jgi:hypothetical protein
MSSFWIPELHKQERQHSFIDRSAVRILRGSHTQHRTTSVFDRPMESCRAARDQVVFGTQRVNSDDRSGLCLTLFIFERPKRTYQSVTLTSTPGFVARHRMTSHAPVIAAK